MLEKLLCVKMFKGKQIRLSNEQQAKGCKHTHLHVSAQLIDLLLMLHLLGLGLSCEHGNGGLLLSKLCMVLLSCYPHLAQSDNNHQGRMADLFC